MAYNIFLKPEAIKDIEAIVEFYGEQSDTASKKVFNAIINRIEKLHTFPDRGRIPPEFRDEAITKYRELIEGYFRIIYRCDDKKVTVIRVLDSRSLSDLQAE